MILPTKHMDSHYALWPKMAIVLPHIDAIDALALLLHLARQALSEWQACYAVYVDGEVLMLPFPEGYCLRALGTLSGVESRDLNCSIHSPYLP